MRGNKLSRLHYIQPNNNTFNTKQGPTKISNVSLQPIKRLLLFERKVAAISLVTIFAFSVGDVFFS